MFKKQGNVFWVVVVVIVIAILWQTGIIEHLTGNAPKEMPLPSQMKPEDDKGKIGVYDKRFLDTRDIPTGYDTSDTSYLLSPETVTKLQPTSTTSTIPTTQSDTLEVQILKEKVDVLTKEIEQLKKQTAK